ncbi:Histone H3-like centromeric protein cpar-1 [Caenorhabditis elegans]|uniref:Histone H3-like centromeric protein cpar-1 n=1 Tax=Caenorhabditis elegans TaxID=6239 RepID=HCP3L_CAEEL|nr:Histone H3-like centromeric protein cpar-1 [Caenorhabditis elegans]P34440.1 RecName: Full=Histone H3-like centromeric protein cpar-1; AltName: Full=CENP-A-related protein 1; AltName: Full=Centromeric protein A related [Caenorhabditis elegans]CAA80154.1 Histone H3-like centromeric protein cpar-1 [Caenorhabditis elegans]|eukprot:NP_499073.1 Histone H3-like centromeric protein cpar-1 [Caenorhabditis elegans]
MADDGPIIEEIAEKNGRVARIMQRLQHDTQRVTSVPGFNTSATGYADLIALLDQYKNDLEAVGFNDLEQARRRAPSVDITVGSNSTNLVDYSHGRHDMPSHRRHDSSDEEITAANSHHQSPINVGNRNDTDGTNGRNGSRAGSSSSDRVRMIAGRNRISKTRRYRPGQKALEEIRKYQESEDLLIPKAPFARLVREIMQTSTPFSSDLRIRSDAINALQEASEALLVQMFDGSSLISAHSKRATLTTTDVQLYRRLCLPNL